MSGQGWKLARLWRRVFIGLFGAWLLSVPSSEGVLAFGAGAPEETSKAREGRSLFGFAEIEYPAAIEFAKWTEVLSRYQADRRSELALCLGGDCLLLRWRYFLVGLKRSPPLAQLKLVNDYLNRFPYRPDLENYGAEDYWATPRELFARGGDCEDYAIAKYLSLRALGWPAEQLQIVVVNDRTRDLVHAALIARQGDGAYLLDIEIAEVTDHRRVTRYAPIFSINETAWFSYQSSAPVDVERSISAPPTRP
nr:transglutaminase-like cysteine peptidase [Nitrosomonas nitrosa]